LKEVKNPMRLIRQTIEIAEIIVKSIGMFVYIKNRLALKNTIPE
jgi:hypothetical protein